MGEGWEGGGGKVEYSHDTVRPSPTRGIPDKAVEHLLEACSVLYSSPTSASFVPEVYPFALRSPERRRNLGEVKAARGEFERLNRPGPG